MLKDQEIKILPSKAKRDTRRTKKIELNYIPWLATLVIIFFILLILISLLPLSGCMKILSLISGTFLILDILHSIKYYVKNRQQTN